MLTLRHDAGQTPGLLALGGSLTIYEVREAYDGLKEVLAGGQREWRLDLAELEEMDSAGAQLLLALQRHLQGLDGKLDVRNPTAPVLEMLELLHLQALYPDVLPAQP